MSFIFKRTYPCIFPTTICLTSLCFLYAFIAKIHLIIIGRWLILFKCLHCVESFAKYFIYSHACFIFPLACSSNSKPAFNFIFTQMFLNSILFTFSYSLNQETYKTPFSNISYDSWRAKIWTAHHLPDMHYIALPFHFLYPLRHFEANS